MTDRMGREKLFLYDALGRMTSQVWENSSGTPVETLAYSFDAYGNMLSAGNSNGTYPTTYDNLNRPSTAQDMWSNTLTFGYDANCRVTATSRYSDSVGSSMVADSS